MSFSEAPSATPRSQTVALHVAWPRRRPQLSCSNKAVTASIRRCTVKSRMAKGLIDALNEGIIECIRNSGQILPTSSIRSGNQCDCQWTEYASSVEYSGYSSLCSPVIDDLRQLLPELHDILARKGDLVASDGRPPLYAACLGLLLSPRESHSNTKGESKVTPLSIFLDIAEFLDDELDVDINEPTQAIGACHRPPLHLLARACYPEAVDFLLNKGADVNSTDDEGWTALMACCLPDIPSEEDGGPSDKERVATVKALRNDWMEREHIYDLEVDAQNYCGYTALHYACEALNPNLIRCLLEAELAADVSIWTVWGESAIGIVRSHFDKNPEKAAVCEAILMNHWKVIKKSKGKQCSLIEDEKKAFDLFNFIDDVLIPASRCGDGVEDELLFEQDKSIVTALLKHLKLDTSILLEDKQSTNIYETIHQRVLDLIPPALIRVYRNRNPTDDERRIITCMNYALRDTCIQMKDGARYVDHSLVMAQAFCLHRERGFVARQVELLTNLFVGPLQRTFSFAVASNAVIEKICRVAPRILEVGAGTGYWSFLLSQFGTDVVAYDSNPPGMNTSNSDGENIYFGSQCYYPVKYGIASTIFDGSCSDAADRALLIVWPNNPDAVDNPHLAVGANSFPELWDYECIKMYHEIGGATVIYVGERGENIDLNSDATTKDWGFCASKKFQEFLVTNFKLKTNLECPKWWMKEDDITVWERLS